ncbi:HNH endonuclease [Bacillus phage W.Ph.]|uniref:Gp55 n=1 Tax=Bacillus phage W.Ph. TaxID=764595 RepID=G9B1F6_9CAUD|nr:HNH endonuclease [Bacillus phage W.Ph.]ADH03201.1 gp55 [Bacillus phage W.Ph.]
MARTQAKSYVGTKVNRMYINGVVSIKGRNHFNCTCDCGTVKVVRCDGVINGTVKSCGCLMKETNRDSKLTHGDSYTRLYSIYQNMKARCNNPNNPKYEYYGGRGIAVCEEWLTDFATFKQWSETNGYNSALTIDRVDNNKNYEPDNCRWVTMAQQLRNTRRSKLIEYNGEVKSLVDWCLHFDIPYKSTQTMLSKGEKTIEEIFTRKVNRRGEHGRN